MVLVMLEGTSDSLCHCPQNSTPSPTSVLQTSKHYSLLTSSDLIVVLPLTLPLRLYSPRPLRFIKEGRASPGLLQGRETAEPRVRPGTSSNNALQPNSCTSSVPANKRQVRIHGEDPQNFTLKDSKKDSCAPPEVYDSVSKKLGIKSHTTQGRGGEEAV